MTDSTREFINNGVVTSAEITRGPVFSPLLQEVGGHQVTEHYVPSFIIEPSGVNGHV